MTLDEFASHNRHRYATVAVDPIHRQVLWIAPGRSRETARAFFEPISEGVAARSRCIISVEVSGPDALGTYTGTLVVTHKEGKVEDDRQFTPTWQKPAFSEAEVFAALMQLAKDIIDGAKRETKSRTAELVPLAAPPFDSNMSKLNRRNGQKNGNQSAIGGLSKGGPHPSADRVDGRNRRDAVGRRSSTAP